MENLIYTT